MASKVANKVRRKLRGEPGLSARELLDRANRGYPDGYLSEYYTKNGEVRRRGSGDGLARFIVTELVDTHDPELAEEEQVDEAVHVLERARDEVQGTIDALRKREKSSEMII